MIKAMSSLAVKAAYLELQPRFEKDAGEKIETEWIGMVDIRKRVLAGEVVDLVIGAAALVDELIRAGKLAAGSRTDLVRSGVTAAVRKGAPKPDISTVEALKRALLDARSILYSAGPSGVYLAELFKRLGVDEKLKATAKQAPPGVFVGELIAKGEAELGFQQLPELLPVKGIDIVGPLPAEVQRMTVFSGGIHARAKSAAAAKQWLAFLKSPANASVLRRHGMEPA
jgi:molybdate transport system substrate-binding protein